ncbi:hypothetical protein MHK_000792, partial [Candidatus Magnetomorum sp. HK-1]
KIWRSDKRKNIAFKMSSGLYETVKPCCDCVYPFTDNLHEIEVSENDLKRPEMQLLSKIHQLEKD